MEGNAVRLRQILSVLTTLIIGLGLCAFSQAEGMDYIIPPPLTEWPSDPGPKPERPIYPAIQAWVTALEKTTSWKYSDWVQPGQADDLFLLFQHDNENLLLYFNRSHETGWQLKLCRENALPMVDEPMKFQDVTGTNNYYDDSVYPTSFVTGVEHIVDDASFFDQSCFWIKEENGTWHLTSYSYCLYDDNEEWWSERVSVELQEDQLGYFTGDTLAYESEYEGTYVNFPFNPSLEAAVVDTIPKTPEEARKAAGKE